MLSLNSILNLPRGYLSAVNLARLGAVVGISLLSTACFQPLHGTGSANGVLSQKLAAIDIRPIVDRLGQERIGYYIQQEISFDLNTTNEPVKKQYRLEMTVNETIQSPIVDTATGRADSATITADINYTLKSFGSDSIITQGKAVASATYDRNPQRFASLRAARDAEIRISKLIADQIRTRLSIALSAAQ